MIDDACIMCINHHLPTQAHRQIQVLVSHLIGRCTDIRFKLIPVPSDKGSTRVGPRSCWTFVGLRSHCYHGRSGAEREVK